MRAILAVLLMLTATAVRADDDVSPDLKPEYYDTELQAATAALQLSYDRSNAYEYGGVILSTTNGKFRISDPETSYRGDGVSINYDNDYAGYEAVATYHTHPCLPYSHWPAVFSDGDANSDTKAGITGYMADLCSGVIRRFIPGVTPRDMSWDNGPGMEKLAAALNIDLRGAHGEAVAEITLNPKLPVMQELPGPKTKARGLNCW